MERLIERLLSCDIGKAKPSVPSFENLPNKFSITAAFSGFLFLSFFETSTF